ncbi:hypothetical protein CJ232_00225 [Hoylesella timonensis]|uniref:Uncharacterized protein n=1 Tax=Hoylesella timonensis TaxID=386414 RepID=A0A2N6Q8G2_9BACT|nr:hypothetical protein CJ232_00225 [Hoylesella timonensis]
MFSSIFDNNKCIQLTKLAHQLFIDVSEILQFCYLEQDVLAFYSNHILLELLLFLCGSNLPYRTLSNEELTFISCNCMLHTKLRKSYEKIKYIDDVILIILSSFIKRATYLQQKSIHKTAYV